MKKRINEQILLMAILGLTIVIVWIYTSVFKIIDQPENKPVLTPQETKIINPQLDQEVFNELEKRSY